MQQAYHPYGICLQQHKEQHIQQYKFSTIKYCNPFQIHSVESFVCSVNTHLTTRQENERLKGVMARIEFYDVVVRYLLVFLHKYSIRSEINLSNHNQPYSRRRLMNISIS